MPAGPADDLDVPTLRAVLDSLGTEFVQLLSGPPTLDVAVARPVIHDPLEPLTIQPGDLVLAIGTDVAGRGAVSLVHNAATTGAAGIVFKLSTPATAPAVVALREEARSAGVAILGLAPDMAWSQLHTLVRTMTAGGSFPRGADGDSGGVVGGLFNLANAIAAMVGGPTTIEDRESTVLAYSNLDEEIDEHRRQTILGHRVPESWRRRLQDDGVFRRLWAEEGPVAIYYPDAEPPMQRRLAVAVRAGDEILGSIWVAEGSRPLTDADADALRDAARIAALQLIRSRSSEDMARERRNALLRSVLDGETSPEVLADALDVSPDAFVTVVAFRLDTDDADEQAIRTRRATDLISLSCESFRRKVACIATGPVVYVLLPDATAPDRRRFVELARDIAERMRGPLRLEVSAGIGSTVAGVAQVVASRRQADRALRVLAPTNGIATIEEVRSLTILEQLRDIARRDPDLLEGKLAAMTQSTPGGHDDNRHATNLTTLKEYLDAFGDVTAAAAKMNVHQNTFRYRLRRMTETAGLDLNDPVERLVLHLQLHLRGPG